jgi:hypothetical protein
MTVNQHKSGKITSREPVRAAEILREFGPFDGADHIHGVTYDGQMWHGTWEGDESDIRRINPQSGAVLQRLEMPASIGVSGLESDGADLFYCGGGPSGKIRVVRRSTS